jgi:lysozyme
MTALDIALRIAKHFEGCATKLPDGRVQAYWDADGGVWTIGWGATGLGITKGTVWTQAQCDEWIAKRMAKDLVTIANELPSLNANELGACGCLAYNIGMKAFLNSTLVKQIKAGNKAAAADQFLRWDKAGGKVMRGLSRRRKCERAVFLGSPLNVIEAS